VGIQVFERPEPLMLIESATRIRVDRRVAGYLATVGRFGVVWLPAYAFASNRVGSTGGATLLASVLAGLWFLTLSHSFDAARLTRLSLGPAVAAALGTATGAIAVCALKFWIHFPLTPVQLIELTALAFVGSWLWEVQVHRSVAARRRVLVIGGEDATKLVEAIRSEEEAPFDVVSLLDDDQAAEIAGYLVEERKPDIVVLATDDPRPRTFEQLLDAASSCAFKVVGLPEFHEHAFGRVPVRTLSAGWFVNVLHLYRRPYTRLAKRTFDVAVAAFGLLLTAWAFPLLAFVVSRTKGPVVFRQTRLGEGGQPFTIYKFRTMRVDAEASGAVWAAERDPRITRAGAFMRKTRLDELPQLWNVLKGDMSIVGPRPERPEFVDQLQEAVPFWSRRHLVKPGITGWAQVRRGYTADAEGTADKLAYDLWYLRHRSLLLDAAICVKTFSTLLTGSGAR
jgi:exopolysaccharide biosynthesis polyprenyl glycosylphosphotransferase